jgi:hypothetical protein
MRKKRKVILIALQAHRPVIIEGNLFSRKNNHKRSF